MTHSSLIQMIGRTPMVEMPVDGAQKGVRLLLKLERQNPGGSVKDRTALAMIEDAEQRGVLTPGGTIIEPTSGNTGVGLAWIGRTKGYRVVLTMPDTMSVERRNLLRAYGAELVLTPGAEGMKGAIARAEALRDATPGSIILGQFTNPANPEVHYRTTGPEIWNDTCGQVDVFVAGVGTGGTVSGVGRALKEHKADIEIIAVEPDASPVLSGGQAGPHKIQGIGAGFVPQTYQAQYVDRVMRITNDEAYEGAHRLAEQGLLVGISSGAAYMAAMRLARQPEYAGRTIVALLPDTGERYLSVL
ncbi:MAG: cysteine synthase A [Paludibacteraceae bacterium]|nr:cysteine synthase A [Paludibacteraceae bacterium]